MKEDGLVAPTRRETVFRRAIMNSIDLPCPEGLVERLPWEPHI